LVPFSQRSKAEEFMAEFGGQMVRIDAIDTDDLLGEDKPMDNMATTDHNTR